MTQQYGGTSGKRHHGGTGPGVAQLTGLVAVNLAMASDMVGGLRAICDCRVKCPHAATALLCYIQCYITS